MSWMQRIVVLAVVLGTGAPLTGCAPRGSSFETLGVRVGDVVEFDRAAILKRTR